MTTKAETLLPLPDPPEREPDDMTSVQHLGENGNLHHLIQYLGNPETTIVSGERYIVPEPGMSASQRIAPDMLISFNSNPELYRQDNSYVISKQGKPPDLVMEIASERTGKNDVDDKPARYAALGIPEYWRFDETGNFHGTKLAGDRLVEGRYEPVDIEELADGVMQGYSAVLNLFIRWEQGRLAWHDPATGRHILTYDDQRARAEEATASAESERAARMEAAAQAEAAEARAEAAEAELHRLREG